MLFKHQKIHDEQYMLFISQGIPLQKRKKRKKSFGDIIAAQKAEKQAYMNVKNSLEEEILISCQKGTICSSSYEN